LRIISICSYYDIRKTITVLIDPTRYGPSEIAIALLAVKYQLRQNGLRYASLIYIRTPRVSGETVSPDDKVRITIAIQVASLGNRFPKKIGRILASDR